MIPKVIHHSAPKNRGHWHHIWNVCFETWKEKFPEPEYEHVLWDDEKIDRFIEEKFPQYFAFYRSLPFHIIQLDFFRFALLHEHGGVYADMDMYCVQNFFDQLEKPVAFVSSPYVEGQLENSLMAAEAGCEHLLKLMDSCVTTFKVLGVRDEIVTPEGCEYVFQLCGPEQIRNYYNSLSEDEKTGIQVLDHSDFNPRACDVDDASLFKHFTIHLNTGNWGHDFTKYIERAMDASGGSYKHNTFMHWTNHSPVWAYNIWDVVVPKG